MADDDNIKTLSECIADYESFESSTNDSRALAEKCIDYLDHIQYSPEERKELEDRGQPAITSNYIARTVKALVGYERQGRTSVKAYPRNPDDAGAADAATDFLRYLSDTNNLDVTLSDCWRDLLTPGTTGVYVRVKSTPRNEVEVVAEEIPYDRQWYDQRSRYLDFRDAKYLGMVMWMDEDDAKETFPEKEEVVESSIASGNVSSSNSGGAANRDRPVNNWVDTNFSRPRLKVVEEYYRKGTIDNPIWYYCIFTRSGFLVEPQESPYQDKYGRPVCPILLHSAYIDRQNKRYGEVRFLLDLQDEVNKRRSKFLHQINMRQIVMDAGAVDDPARVAADMSRPDAIFMPREGARFEILPSGEMSAGQFQLLLEAKSELNATGGTAALSGTEPHQLSGIAEQRRQQAGISSIQSIFDQLRQLKKRVYEAMWERTQQFVTAETWIRITDDRDKTRFVGVNRQTTLWDALHDPEDSQIVLNRMDPQIAQVAQTIIAQQIPLQQLPLAIQQILTQPITLDNIAEMDVDIIISEIPDVVNSQMEQMGLLIDLVRAGGQIPQDALIKAFLQMSNFPNKEELIDIISGKSDQTPEQQQALAAAQQQQQQIQQQGLALQFAQAQADIEKTRAEADYKKVQAAQGMGELVKDKELPADHSLQPA